MVRGKKGGREKRRSREREEGERREVGRRGDQGREKRVKRGKEETSILVLLAWKVPIKIHRGLH